MSDDGDIAIIGMAGRFPGAPDVDQLWRRIAAGDDCLEDLDDPSLLARGVPPTTVADPAYVPRSGILDDVEGFDHAFFGIGARDAAVMDPQHRHFLECSWAALESAAIVPDRFPGAIGVFGGCGMNTYLINNLLTNETVLPQLGWFLLRHTGNDKDFLTNNVAYRLDLRGPAVNVQTACSTSLVAVHLAVQSLLGFETDVALAGGVTIEVPHRVGYRYHEGEILAPDGVCRAFDTESHGTVLTSGVGVVALRRLGEALEAGDPVLAVLRATAINNDGTRKVGFLAPSVDGHRDVVNEALTLAGLSARDLQLIEAHGTGTAVGDPIEFAALSEAFHAFTTDQGFCRLTSTKPNIGHLDTAAGVASLIKVVQALRHQTLPPMANFTGPSPLIDIDRSPFVLSGSPAAWPGDRVRRAGISSLGVGGTNAHVIVEEAPPVPTAPPSRDEQVLVVSALVDDALDDASAALADALEADPTLELADVAHTLTTGRRAMPRRQVVTATDRQVAISVLRAGDRYRRTRHHAPADGVRLGFMFPGGGSQYVGMGAQLDERFGTFHRVRREGIELVRSFGGPDLAPLLAPGGDPEQLRRASASLPAVFITSVAMARQWMEFGARPDVLLGHSLGEYTAAHLAGVFSFEDAAGLVVARSQLMERASGGAAMLAVPLPASEVHDRLPPELTIAVINTDDECVVAGHADAIAAFAAELADEGLTAATIPLSAAAHSSLLDPVLDELRDRLEAVTMSPPQLPYPSNLTGEWITPEQATDPAYWVAHTRQTVRFHDCVRVAVDGEPTVLVELGPGQALSSFARRSSSAPHAVIPTLRHPDHDASDTSFTLHAFARQWAAGADVDLDQLSEGRTRRVRLPTYPFQHERAWIEPGSRNAAASPPAAAGGGLERIDDLDRTTWTVDWVPAGSRSVGTASGRWVVLGDVGDPRTTEVAVELGHLGADVAIVSDAGAAAAATGVVVIAPTASSWARSTERWFVDTPAVIRSLGATAGPTRLVVLTSDALGTGRSATNAVDAMALGVALVAAQEYPMLTTRVVDLDPTAAHGVRDLVADMVSDVGPDVVALRGDVRVVPDVTPRTVTAPADGIAFRRQGVYFVTGGLGGVGHEIARHLAEQYQATLVVLSSAPLPDRSARAAWWATHAHDDPTSRRLRQLASLEELGSRVEVVVGDAADDQSLRRALDTAEALVGPIDGAIHAAGLLRDSLLETATTADHCAVLGAKAGGALALVEELSRRGRELLVLVSSTSTVLAPEGQSSYVGANAVLDALAGRLGALTVKTINFGLWSEVGIASDLGRRTRLGLPAGAPLDHAVLSEASRDRNGITTLVGRLGESHWLLDGHRTVDGLAIYPGTGHLELMVTAARHARDLTDVTLADVTFVSPLIVRPDQLVTVRVTVDEDGAIDVHSDLGAGTEWHLHSQSRIDAGPLTVAPRPVRPDDLTELAADPLAHQRHSMRFGDRWDAVTEHRGDETTRWARIAMTSVSADELTRWNPHPVVVDVAVAVATGLGRSEDVTETALYVPARIGHVRVRGALPSHVTVVATRAGGHDPDRLRADLRLDGGDDGAVDIEGLELRRVADHSVLQRTDGAVATSTARRGGLVELADELGLRPAEGAQLLERLVTGPYDRLIGSTLDLARLRSSLAEPEDGTGDRAEAATASSLEAALAAMWSDLLGVDEVGADDDFFDLGGHSLIAIRLMSRIQTELGVRLQLNSIFDASTLGRLTAVLRTERPDLDAHFASVADTGHDGTAPTAVPAAETGARRHLVPISTTGEGRPLFVVHGAGGNILFLARFARAMSSIRPVYGFEAHGVDQHDVPDDSVEQMAERYVQELRAHGPGPYHLGGYSGGGIVALEMVRQLQRDGERVDTVVLFDSPVGHISLGRWVHARHLARNAARHGPQVVGPILTSRLQATDLGRRLLFRGERSEHEITRERNYLDSVEHGFHDLYDHFGNVVGRYDVGSYDVDVVLVQAQLRWPLMPRHYGWDGHIRGRLEVRVAPGDHESMFHGRNVEHLVATIAPLIVDRDAAPTP